jgi:predicted porin
LTFGDKSWGSIKLGKDLGIYASDAILNDMTLLGVGSSAGSLAGNTTTLGRIGRGFMYADWKSQVAYSSPNFNGFSFTVGLTQGWNAQNTLNAEAPWGGNDGFFGGSTERAGSQTAYEGKVSYEWAGDVSGKVWASAITQKVEGLAYNPFGAGPNNDTTSDRATAWDIGATVNVAGFGLTGYYGDGKGIGQTVQFLNGFDNRGKRRDSDNWYVQGTYTIPGVGTKLGVSYGESTLDGTSNDNGSSAGSADFKELEQNMWTVGAYHPITKHLNLVAEYSEAKDELRTSGADTDVKAKTISLGAILFF